MDFKLPNNNFNENQIKILENIQLSQNNILAQFSDLNKRISELENSQQAVISKISHQNKSDEPLSFSDRLNLNISLTLAVTLIICIALIVFGWHFWDIPSQTQAVNDYIYTKIISETATQLSPYSNSEK